MDNYDLVPSGLIKLIKQSFNQGLDHAGSDIGQPTRFFVGCALNLVPQDPAAEIKNLRRKLKAGADFVLTQPVFEPALAEAFLERLLQPAWVIGYPDPGGRPTAVQPAPRGLPAQRSPRHLHPRGASRRIRMAGERAPQEGVQIALELVEQMRALGHAAST